jgi:UDP-2-acetamido-3-amino-2,3-dideoxy-glucuronate N-acetyltransferase
MPTLIHPSASVSPYATIGAGCAIWQHSRIQGKAQLGESCIIGKDVIIERGVHLGRHVRIEEGVTIKQGVSIGDGARIGAGTRFIKKCFERIVIGKGAVVGENATILGGVRVGDWARIEPGSQVRADVLAHAVVSGELEGVEGFACYCGARLEVYQMLEKGRLCKCPDCIRIIELPFFNHG